jgi:hypothetical protein
MNSNIEGYGSYGIIYSTPRLPYSIKYNFSKKILDNFFEEPFPYIEDYSSDDNKDDYKSDNFLKNEASKVFFDTESYDIELGEYIYVLSNYNIPDEYFNKPLNYGLINKKYII